ncbi:Lipoprotein releasing system transmembrane protein LolC [Minicystis rosea]|nr:Lipoprotein releasing system transmembrane protein LolC [Minicystis rosea]
MGYPVDVALRYLGSKKRAFISVGTAFAILGVTLGVAALATVMSVTGGFQAQFREKVLGVNAHVLVLKYSTDFREYRTIMDQVAKVPGVVGTAPFSINPMMLTHGDASATGVLLKGVDPALSLGVGAPPGTKPVLVVPQQIVGCEPNEGRSKEAATACALEKLQGLRAPGAKPAERKILDAQKPPLPLDDLDPLDGGADEYDDAGRNLNLIRKIEADIKRREDEAARKKAQGSEKSAGQADAAATDDAKLDDILDAGAPSAPAPQGDVVPDGGYKSRFGADDDDVLPPEVDPDPCTDPAKISKMPGIVVGISLAKTLHLEIGDCVTVTSPTIGYSFSGGSLKPPVARRFRVIALFQAGFDQYDSKLVYTDLFEAQTFYDQGDTVTGVEMIVDDIDKAPKISRQIAEMLGSGLYHTMDWEELNHGLFTALRIQQIGMSAVLALIIIVAAFTVIATLIMVVLDKTKEIAVMKAMGATDQAILRIFLYQGGLIGFMGTALGLLLGLVVCKLLLVYGFPLDPKVYFISRLPVQVRLQEFLITGEVALAICIEATVLPSLYAASLSPVEGFREQIGSSDGGRGLGRLMTAWIFLIHIAYTLLTIGLLIQMQTNADLSRLMRLGLAGGAIVTAFGAVAALAMLVWKRWGFYVLSIVQVVTAATLVFLAPVRGPMAIAVSPLFVLLILTFLGLRKNWRFFD